MGGYIYTYIYIYVFMCFCPIGVFLTLGAAAPGYLRPEWPWVCFCPIGVLLPLGAAAPGDLRPEWPWVGSCPPSLPPSVYTPEGLRTVEKSEEEEEK